MKRLDKAYAAHNQSPNHTTEAALFHELQQFAQAIGTRVFNGNLPDTHEIIQEAAENAMIQAPQHDDSKGNFSSFAYRVIECDFLDWIRIEQRHEADSIDDPASKLDQLHDTSLSLETRTYYQQVLDGLNPRNRQLFRMRAEGVTFEEMSSLLDMSESAVKREWAVIQMRLKSAHLRQTAAN